MNSYYNRLGEYLQNTYGEKLYKLALNGGFTCPNRDGTLDHRGCIFCSAGGSGEFATVFGTLASDEEILTQQIETAIDRLGEKGKNCSYIAYFQAFTSTYDKPERLLRLYRQALSHPLIRGLSIGTRPDCLGDDVLHVLSICQNEYPDKFIWVELGLQTIHESTAIYIRRGYSLSVFEQACEKLHKLNLPIIVHIILGLPGESDEMTLQTISYLNQCGISGIKLQLLHVLEGTDLAAEYRGGKFEVLTKEHYIDLLIKCIEHLNKDIILHRVTGDGSRNLLLEPTWSLHKRSVINELHHQMKLRNSYQGKALDNN